MNAPPAVRTSRLIGAAGAGVLLSGIVVNVYLAVVARALPPAEYVAFGAFWSLGLVVAFGAFLPIEQELARRLNVAADPRRQLRAAAVVAGGAALLTIGVLLALTPVVLGALDHQTGALVALTALVVVSGLQFLLRGTLIGGNRLVRHGAVMVLDALLRLALAGALFVVGGHDAVAFCWALVVAIALAHVPLLPAAWRRAATAPVPGVAPEAGTGAEPFAGVVGGFARATAPLLVGSVCAQLLLNGVPVLVAAVASGQEQAAAGVFVAAFTLARAPLSIVVPLQSAVVPTLTRLLAQGRRSEVYSLLARGAVALAGLAVVGMPLAALVGPALVRLVFGGRYLIGGAALAVLTGGILVHIALVVLTQVHVARARHRFVALSWLVALAAGAVVFVTVPDLFLAAELAFAVGSLAGAAAAVGLLLAGRSGGADGA